MDLIKYKVLQMTFELTRLRIGITIQVEKHLEISVNLLNGALSYYISKVVYIARWRLSTTPDTP